MSARRGSGPSLAAGLALGIAGDVLFRAPGSPGLNLFAWVALAGVAGLVLRRRGGDTTREAGIAVMTGIVCAAMLMWRDAEFLKLLALGLTLVLFGLAAFRRGAEWIRRGGVGEYAVAMIAGGMHGAAGALAALAGADWQTMRSPASGRWRFAASAVRGIALVIPLVIVFGGLFIAADAVFAQMVANVIRIDIETFASHVALSGFIGWLAAGCLYGFVNGTAVTIPATLRPARPGLPIVEAGVALGVLNALFLVFVLVQFRYLFGGAQLIEVTAGLTYAEYARRGFFELVFVALLVLPTLLAADWLLRREREADQRIFRLLSGLLVMLVFAVMASALQRMRLYVEAYGLTEQRLYATALLAFLAIVFLWLALTVLRARRSRFAFGSLVTGGIVVLSLFIANPDAIIARTNLARAVDADAVPFDARYASTLSADAVPVLLSALPDLPPEQACPVASRLLDRFGPGVRAPLRTWSWSVHEARERVRRHAAALTTLVPGGGCAAL